MYNDFEPKSYLQCQGHSLSILYLDNISYNYWLRIRNDFHHLTIPKR